MAALRRELGLFSATALIVGSIVGSGIFFGPQNVAVLAPFGLTIMLVWLVAGVLSLLGALCIAELGAAMPQSGGQYVYIRRAFGDLPAFLNGWTSLFAGKGAAVAAVSVAFGTFLQLIAPWPLGPPGYAVALIAALTLANLVGVRQASLVQNSATVLKVLGIGAVILLGMTAGARGRGFEPLLPLDGLQGSILAAFGVALVPALFAYDGWYFSAQVAEEVRDPGRTLPRSIVLGMAVVMVLYLAINYVYAGVLGPQGLASVGTAEGAAIADRHSPAVAVASLLLGPAGVALVVAAVLVSTFGTANGITLTGPRISYAMARDGLFFQRFARLHPRWRTPATAIVAQGAIGIALAASGTFAQLILLDVVHTFLFSGLAVVALLRLRRTEPSLPRPYRVPLYPLVPLLFIGLSIVLLTASVVAEPLLTGGFLLYLALGVPLYVWFEARKPRGRREVVLGDLP
ncbi:MAG TPA: amino acid permease [Candidatus Thermoplasmatota archaeon]|nr:amino acid permease [Candidatus Thermoplasmatota archaeon]